MAGRQPSVSPFASKTPCRSLPSSRVSSKALSEVSGKSNLAKAIRYALARWTALTRYTTDGRPEMTNNAVERAIRPLAMTESFYTSFSSTCKH